MSHSAVIVLLDRSECRAVPSSQWQRVFSASPEEGTPEDKTKEARYHTFKTSVRNGHPLPRRWPGSARPTPLVLPHSPPSLSSLPLLPVSQMMVQQFFACCLSIVLFYFTIWALWALLRGALSLIRVALPQVRCSEPHLCGSAPPPGYFNSASQASQL